MSLLEPANLEHVEVRLHSVLQKLDKIAEKKSTQEDGEKQNKVINYLFVHLSSVHLYWVFPGVRPRISVSFFYTSLWQVCSTCLWNLPVFVY